MILDRAPHLQLLGAHGLGVERIRWLHRDERQHLHQVVLQHVAGRAGLLIEGSASLDADALGAGDLDVIDEVPVPDRLEDAVAEAEHQDVLHRLLAQIVVDAEDLILRQNRVHLVVQLARRLQIVAERLLDDHANPRATLPTAEATMPCLPRRAMMSAKNSGATAR